MLGAIVGDIIGSVYEFNPIKSTEFPLFVKESTFTDDTVLTVAVAYSIINKVDYKTILKEFGLRYPNVLYGTSFRNWLLSRNNNPYNSWGNGSAMRVSPVGFAFNSEEAVLLEAKKSAEVTHNHQEGIKGAQAVALSIFFSRIGKSKKTIKEEISKRFNYDLNRPLDEIRPKYGFDESCQGTVPESIIAFLESKNFEDAIRKAVSLGGDSDTIACITGGIAQAFYKKIPKNIIAKARGILPKEFLEIIDLFNSTFTINIMEI